MLANCALAAALEVNVTLTTLRYVLDGMEISYPFIFMFVCIQVSAALCHPELCVETCFFFMQEELFHLRCRIIAFHCIMPSLVISRLRIHDIPRPFSVLLNLFFLFPCSWGPAYNCHGGLDAPSDAAIKAALKRNNTPEVRSAER